MHSQYFFGVVNIRSFAKPRTSGQVMRVVSEHVMMNPLFLDEPFLPKSWKITYRRGHKVQNTSSDSRVREDIPTILGVGIVQKCAHPKGSLKIALEIDPDLGAESFEVYRTPELANFFLPHRFRLLALKLRYLIVMKSHASRCLTATGTLGVPFGTTLSHTG